MSKFAAVVAGLLAGILSCTFDSTASAQAQDGTSLRQVRFPQPPRGYENLGPVGPYYPERAYRHGASGAAEIACHVASDGALKDCVVARETGDWDFGVAATVMARRHWIMAAPKADGSPEVPDAIEHFLVRFELRR